MRRVIRVKRALFLLHYKEVGQKGQFEVTGSGTETGGDCSDGPCKRLGCFPLLQATQLMFICEEFEGDH
ncbi:hypothetical protein Tco_0695597 [Tanacetum coccineum]